MGDIVFAQFLPTYIIKLGYFNLTYPIKQNVEKEKKLQNSA